MGGLLSAGVDLMWLTKDVVRLDMLLEDMTLNCRTVYLADRSGVDGAMVDVT